MEFQLLYDPFGHVVLPTPATNRYYGLFTLEVSLLHQINDIPAHLPNKPLGIGITGYVKELYEHGLAVALGDNPTPEAKREHNSLVAYDTMGFDFPVERLGTTLLDAISIEKTGCRILRGARLGYADPMHSKEAITEVYQEGTG